MRRDFLETGIKGGILAAAVGTGAYGAPPDAQAGGKLKILILGGTGFIGPHIVETAQGRGHTLTLFNRGKTNPQLFPDIEKLRGDRNGDLKALEGRKWDAVIDDCGYVPREVKLSGDLLSKAVGHYLFVSSISAYAEPGKPGMDEDAPLATMEDPGNEDVKQFYGPLKALSEKAAEASMPGRVTIIRPGLIVGPGDPTDRYSYWPVRVARGGDVLAPGDGKDPAQYIDARDLAAFMVRVVEDRSFGVFNALGPEKPMTMADLLSACKQASASDARFVWAPEAFLEEQKVSPWMDLPVWTGKESAAMAQMSNARAMSKGLTFRPSVDTARDTLAWYRKQPAERQAKMRAGLLPEREAEVLAALKRWKPHAPAAPSGS